MLNLRPQTFDEFLGKTQLKNNLKVFIDSAKQRNTCLDHVLMFGLAGTGKTTLAQIIANEFGRPIKIIQGTQLKKNNDLINFISLINDGDFIFIDEIHAMSIECMETLYSILEDFKLDIKIGVPNNQKITRVALPKFTLIGATTNISKMPKALEERFAISLFFDIYDDCEIEEIIKRSCGLYEFECPQSDIETIASHCKGIPRIANNILKRVIDFKTIDSSKSIKSIFADLQIYEKGLHASDIKYLKMLYANETAVGLKTLSSVLDIEQDVIETKIEPYLLKSNLIKKTNKGREITKLGFQYVSNIYENNKSDQF